MGILETDLILILTKKHMHKKKSLMKPLLLSSLFEHIYLGHCVGEAASLRFPWKELGMTFTTEQHDRWTHILDSNIKPLQIKNEYIFKKRSII